MKKHKFQNIDKKTIELMDNFSKENPQFIGMKKSLIHDGGLGLYLNSGVFVKIWKALDNEFINDKVINDSIEYYLSDNYIIEKFSKDEIKALNALKNKYQQLSSLIEEKCDALNRKIILKREEDKDTFIESIKNTEIRSKKEIAKLCEKTPQWLNDNKDKYNQVPQGVFVKDFVIWLKSRNREWYDTFKNNYKKP